MNKLLLSTTAVLLMSIHGSAASSCIVSGEAENPSHSCPSDGSNLVTGVNSVPLTPPVGLEARYRTNDHSTEYIDYFRKLLGMLIFVR